MFEVRVTFPKSFGLINAYEELEALESRYEYLCGVNAEGEGEVSWLVSTLRESQDLQKRIQAKTEFQVIICNLR